LVEETAVFFKLEDQKLDGKTKTACNGDARQITLPSMLSTNFIFKTDAIFLMRKV
jgi:hypothetical protein